jgi:hypothetical protein
LILVNFIYNINIYNIYIYYINMAKKDKKKRDKKSDKKKKQRRERKGKLPSSVEALLGYLGGGGPTPAPQSDMKGKERAGYDAYDTLHSIIKSQQIQSAGYMANLEKMAFRTEISEQLKKQGQENQQALADTKKDVVNVVETAVGRRKRTEAEKIAEKQAQIAWQMRKRDGADPDVIARHQADIKRYEGIMEYKQSIMPPASSVAPSEMLAQAGRAGGGGGGVRMNVTPAIATSSLPSNDPNVLSYGAIAGQIGILSPFKQQRTAEVNQAMAGFGYSDNTASSLEARNISITLGRQQKQVAQKEAEVFGNSKAFPTAFRSSGRKNT